ncbi:MAG: heparinase II/III family protein [Merdibacter sp.]
MAAFTNGVHGGGHAHEDKLHVDLFYRGEDIVRDSGRLTYVDKPERYEFKVRRRTISSWTINRQFGAFLGISCSGR